MHENIKLSITELSITKIANAKRKKRFASKRIFISEAYLLNEHRIWRLFSDRLETRVVTFLFEAHRPLKSFCAKWERIAQKRSSKSISVKRDINSCHKSILSFKWGEKQIAVNRRYHTEKNPFVELLNRPYVLYVGWRGISEEFAQEALLHFFLSVNR